MNILIRSDSVEIDGYVNAIERKSNPIKSRLGAFVERICKGAFKRALERNSDVKLLLNHNWDRELGSTKNGNLKLEEDSIGLHARAVITDKDVIQKARDGKLVGWSFGFTDRAVENSQEGEQTLRDVKDLDLYEVSLLDTSKKPAYDGTLVTVRDDNAIFHSSLFSTNIETREIVEPAQKDIDYSEFEKMISDMKEDKNV